MFTFYFLSHCSVSNARFGAKHGGFLDSAKKWHFTEAGLTEALWISCNCFREKLWSHLPKLVFQFSSVEFSHSVMSDSFWPHEPGHARPPCPSPTPRVHPNPCPLSQWCHPTISSSVVPFSSCPQSFPASWSFQMSQLFTSGGQSIQLQHQSFQWTPRTDLL